MSNYSSYFQTLIQTDRLVHAYAFVGPSMLQKRDLVDAILQGLLAKQGLSDSAQEVLAQRIREDQFSDIMTVRPQGRSIQVEQIRDLKHWLGLSPLEADFKVGVIEAGEALTPSAANAMLTFLEEPLESVYLFIYCQNFDDLLPTLQSRLQAIYFQTDDLEGQIGKLVEAGLSDHHARLLANLTSNVRSDLIEDYEVETFDHWIRALQQFYRLLESGQAMAFIHVETRLKPFLKYYQASLGLDYLLQLNYLAIILQSKIEEGSPAGLSQLHKGDYEMRDLAQQVKADRLRLLRIHDWLLEAKEYVAANVRPQAAYEQLAIKAQVKKTT